jgi:DinB family protein
MTGTPDRPAEALAAALSAALPGLQAISEAESARPRAPGKWSPRQVLGHLIDSAANNHQRFVRARTAEALTFPGYAQEAWVEAQHYNERAWSELVELWTVLNRHLLHVMERVPPDRLDVPCQIGDGAPVTLGWLMSDYVRHLRHHLAQIRPAHGLR